MKKLLTSANRSCIAITPSPAQSLKRRAPSPENSDSENIDPFQIDLSSKRKRAAFDDDVSLAKQPRLETRIVSNVKTYTPPAPVRQSETVKTGTTPLSAPPAAGRSPTRLHNRYDKSQSKRRFVPPSLKTSSPSISIAAALRGTLAHKRSTKPKKTVTVLEDAKPKSWFFDIFEESEEQQNYRMSEWTMTQSSAALEISDDEDKGSCCEDHEKSDKGKENIDPNEMFVTTGASTRATATTTPTETADQKESKAVEPRTPLGDLYAADFYAEGLDATSVVLVHDDSREDTTTLEEAQEQTETAEPVTATPMPVANDFTFEAPVQHQDEAEQDLINEPIPEWAQQAARNAEDHEQQDDVLVYCDDTAEPADIEIWESESAKDENEYQEESSGGRIVVGEGQTISLSTGIYLQEV